jgi:hypothetical protein
MPHGTPCPCATSSENLIEFGLYNEGHITLEAKTLSLPNLASHCSRVTETSKLIMPTHALEAGQVWLKSVGKEGYFTLQGETHFCPYLVFNCNGLAQTSLLKLPLPLLQALKVLPPSVFNSGQFPLVSKRFSRLYLVLHCSGVTETSIIACLPMLHKQ